MTTQIADLLQREKDLRAARSSWEAHWQELGELLRTERADFTAEPGPGERRTRRVFDGTPQQAARGLASALDGMLKGRQSQWFHLRPEGDALAQDEAVRAWVRDIEGRMWRALYADRAHFAARSFETDLDLVVFGTGVFFTQELPGHGLHFRAFHLRDTLIAENDRGEIDTVLRSFRLTPRQAVQRFGAERVGARTRELLRDGSRRKLRFLHAVMPRQDWAALSGEPAALPVASAWIDADSQHLIGVGGYHEMPYAIPRWETVTGEVYGRSPAMLALPDVQTLNAISQTLLKAGQKAVDPPMLVAQEGLVSGVRLFPGGITYVDYSNVPGGHRPIDPLVGGANLPLGLEMENQRRDMVWAAFFRNVLQLPVAGPNMTATEVLERKAEFMRLIGPTFARLESDYVAPIVKRVFGLMFRAGALPPPPENLRGRPVRFAFDSPVMRAQKQMEALATRGALEQAAPFLDLDPAAADHIDPDAALRLIFEAHGVDGLLRGRADVESLRAARAETQTAAAAVDLVERGAAVAKDLASFDKLRMRPE